jgi:hypothetical protein
MMEKELIEKLRERLDGANNGESVLLDIENVKSQIIITIITRNFETRYQLGLDKYNRASFGDIMLISVFLLFAHRSNVSFSLSSVVTRIPERKKVGSIT